MAYHIAGTLKQHGLPYSRGLQTTWLTKCKYQGPPKNMAYHVAGTSKQEPEGEAAHNADRVNAALHRGGVIVDRYLHVARFTIPSAVTK